METPPGNDPDNPLRRAPAAGVVAADPATWARLKDLVADALECAPPLRRDFLAKACAAFPHLQAQALAMVHAATSAGEFLESPAVADLFAGQSAMLPSSVEHLPRGTVCGPYVIEALLGEGGFSEVYRARQEQPLARIVALKVLKPGMDSRAVLARFALERRTLARLEHPGIARILDAGATTAGRPFVVMEFVDGCTLAQFAKTHELSQGARLELFLQICDGVTHAHQRGVIHRDLKPSNLMVALRDGVPHAKVIDFGIAKVLELDAVEQTHTGQMLGTPGYWSPEQRAGERAEIDVRTDVYALGVVFAELFADELREPRRPQPREFAWIVARACAAERERRYSSVAELAADVRAFVGGTALLAGPQTRRYRLGKFLQRHRTAIVAVSLVTVAFVGGGVAATIGFYRAEEMRVHAEAAQREADTTADYLARLIAEVDPGRAGRDIKVVDLLDASEALLKRAAEAPEAAARLHFVVGKAYRALGEFARARSHLQAAADSYTSRHGELDWRGIEAACELASVMHRAGDLEAAAPLVEAVRVRAVASRGPNHPKQRVLTDLGAKLAFDRGRPAEAEQPLRDLLALDEADGRTDSVIMTLGNLAQVLLSRGAAAEAEVLATRGRDLALAQHGAEHPLTLAAVRKLAAVAVHRGDHAAVTALLAPILPIAERRLGKDHPDTLGIANYLTYALQEQGRIDEAEPLYRELIAAQQRKLDRLHPQAAMTLLNFGRLLFGKREFAAAEPVLRDASQRFGALRGVDDPNALRAACYLHQAVAAQGRHAEVARDYAKTVAALAGHIKEAAFVTSSRTAWAGHLCELGRALQQGGDHAAALAAWEQAFAVAEELHLTAVRRDAALALATALAARGDAAAAARWRDAAR